MLDDDRISPVHWEGAKAQAGDATAEGCVQAGAPMQRIESASAYMIMYRKRGYVHERPGEQSPARQLSPQLCAVVSAENTAFAQEQQTFLARARAVDRFLQER